MFEKAGRYYADWRDESGKRLRKSFTSRRAALTFETEQKEQAHPKPQARGPLSPRSYAHTSKGDTASTRAPQKSSSKLRVVSILANSRKHT